MIRYLSHKNIDLGRYDQCISQAKNSLIYAYSWYLDCVSPNWCVMVLNDYEAVMPLPKRNKFFISYVFQAPWVQQLGVFYQVSISEELILKIISGIPKKFKLIDITFNHDNQFKSNHLSIRDNFIINLNSSYQTLFENYSKSRKSSVKKAKKLNLSLCFDLDIKPIVTMFKNAKSLEIQRTEDEYQLLEDLLLKASKRKMAEVISVRSSNGYLLGGAFFLIDKQRIIYLFSSVNEQGKENQVMSLILDFMIQKYSDSVIIFDFEGSMIPGIATFFKSFGAIRQPYFLFNKKRFPL